MRYHLTAIWMAAIKKKKRKERNNKCWQGRGEIGTRKLCLLVGLYGAATIENTLVIPQKIKNRTSRGVLSHLVLSDSL